MDNLTKQRAYFFSLIVVWLGACLVDHYSSYVLATRAGNLFREANPIISPIYSWLGVDTFIVLGVAAMGIAIASWFARNKYLFMFFAVTIPIEIYAAVHNFQWIAAIWYLTP